MKEELQSLEEHLLQKVVGLTGQLEQGSDEREIGKVTAEVSFDEHVIKFGYEAENLIAVDETTNSGGDYFLLIENDYIADHPRTDGGPGGIGYTAAGYTDEEIVRKRTYKSGGSYKIENSALFVQGSFQLTDRWLLNAGLRSDSFDNGNAVENHLFLLIIN